jgi:DNA polymerase I-like protein with 3'-5' exonuclease and polymerase domains
VRHLPLIRSNKQEIAAKALRQSVNAPVQSTLSDLALWATAELHRGGYTKEAPVVAMVHDQLISYVPEDYLPFAARTKQVMENLPFDKLGWKPALKFTVDTEIGPNLAELKKVKDLA